MDAPRFPGNPCDGDPLAEQLEQTRMLLQDVNVVPNVALVDLGYRGREVDGVQVLHRGKAKTLTRRQWRWIKRRQAVEPVIGQLKHDCRLCRCRLKGAQGDALHVLSCAAGDNLRWLMRWIAFLRAWMHSMSWPSLGTVDRVQLRSHRAGARQSPAGRRAASAEFRPGNCRPSVPLPTPSMRTGRDRSAGNAPWLARTAAPAAARGPRRARCGRSDLGAMRVLSVGEPASADAAMGKASRRPAPGCCSSATPACPRR